jgi:hypothetical protein
MIYHRRARLASYLEFYTAATQARKRHAPSSYRIEIWKSDNLQHINPTHRTFAVLASLTSPGQFRQHVASRRAYPGFRATGFMNNKVSDRAHSCVAMTHATRRASGLREAYAHAAFSHRMSSLKKRTVLARADGDKSGEDTSDFRERNRC